MFHLWAVKRVGIPEIISAEQRCFRDLAFFNADSENMKKTSALISGEQRCFTENQLGIDAVQS